MRIERLISDQNGGVLVETTVMILFALIFLFGAIDFLFAFYQWNVANKAAQFGARIAAVSNPVASDLPNFQSYTGYARGEALLPSSNFYSLTCDGATSRCSCDAGYTCTGVNTNYDQNALNTIVFGRNWLVTGRAQCDPTSNVYLRGMCHMFPRIGVTNVAITYKDTGLGFAYQPNGPTPTIIVRLQNLPFQYFFLSGLLGFATTNIPAQPTSITGEDLSVIGPS
jgi:Flp pilus assembly protein TadG